MGRDQLLVLKHFFSLLYKKYVQKWRGKHELVFLKHIEYLKNTGALCIRPKHTHGVLRTFDEILKLETDEKTLTINDESMINSR